MEVSSFTLPVFGAEDSGDLLPVLRDKYDFDCCACGSVQSAAHLLESDSHFAASGLVLCLRCGVLVRVTIVAGRVVSERESVYQARNREVMQALLREAKSGGS